MSDKTTLSTHKPAPVIPDKAPETTAPSEQPQPQEVKNAVTAKLPAFEVDHYEEYQVKQGDRAWNLARDKMGNALLWTELQKANPVNLADPKKLQYEGSHSTLRIPIPVGHPQPEAGHSTSRNPIAHTDPVNHPAAVPAPAPIKPASGKPIAQWTTTERAAEIFRRMESKLLPDVKAKLMGLLTPEAAKQMAEGLAMAAVVYAAGYFTGISEIATVGGVLLGAYYMGPEAWHVFKDLKAALGSALHAKTEAELDQGAEHLAKAISTGGVDGVLAFLTHKSIKFAKAKFAGTPPPAQLPRADQGSPPQVDPNLPQPPPPVAQPQPPPPVAQPQPPPTVAQPQPPPTVAQPQPPPTVTQPQPPPSTDGVTAQQPGVPASPPAVTPPLQITGAHIGQKRIAAPQQQQISGTPANQKLLNAPEPDGSAKAGSPSSAKTPGKNGSTPVETPELNQQALDGFNSAKTDTELVAWVKQTRKATGTQPNEWAFKHLDTLSQMVKFLTYLLRNLGTKTTGAAYASFRAFVLENPQMSSATRAMWQQAYNDARALVTAEKQHGVSAQGPRQLTAAPESTEARNAAPARAQAAAIHKLPRGARPGFPAANATLAAQKAAFTDLLETSDVGKQLENALLDPSWSEGQIQVLVKYFQQLTGDRMGASGRPGSYFPEAFHYLHPRNWPRLPGTDIGDPRAVPSAVIPQATLPFWESHFPGMLEFWEGYR